MFVRVMPSKKCALRAELGAFGSRRNDSLGMWVPGYALLRKRRGGTLKCISGYG
jgi:hypothetical protein